MKKIFVTITEFLKNGGELIKGRQVYFKDGDEAGLFDYSTPIGNIYVNEFGCNLLMQGKDAYVEIDCQPIYK